MKYLLEITKSADKILKVRESRLIDSIRVVNAFILTVEGMRNDVSFDGIFHHHQEPNPKRQRKASRLLMDFIIADKIG